MKKRKITADYSEALIKSLKNNPEEAAGYLTAALEENDPEIFLLALRDVAEAYGGVGKVSKKARLNRENLYRMLSKKGNPGFYSLDSLLKVFGLKFTVQADVQA